MGCPYQRGLICRASTACAKCGWNPPIHKERVALIRAQRSGKPARQTVSAVKYFNTFGEEIVDYQPKKPDFCQT